MKVRLVILLAFFLFACAPLGFAQTDPQASLFNRFNQIQTGELLYHLDIFFQQLEQKPQINGFVVIYPKKDSTGPDLGVEKKFARRIRNHIYQQYVFDESRVKIVKGEAKDEFEVNLWEVEPGAALPFTIVEDWTEPVFDLSKAFIFGAEDVEYVYSQFAPKMYAKLIKNNPNLRGHIVIFNRSKKEGRSEAARWLKMFADDFQVPANRLKIFFARNNGNPDVEFWIVPRK